MREYGPGRPLVFNHIPKSAGSSLQLALRTALQPETFVGGIDLALLGGYDDTDSVSASAHASIYFEPDQLPADASLVAGHIAPGTTMSRYPDADHITVLRTPQLRLISQWLHGRSLSEFDLRHWGPSADAFRVARLPLRDYLNHSMIAPNVDNTITRFLVWPHPLLHRTQFIDESHDDELANAAIERLGRFAHVNVVENAAFIGDLGAWLGRPLPQTRANERTSVPKRMRPDLEAELSGGTKDLLDHRSRIDFRVWSHVVTRVLPGADPDDLYADALRRSIDRYSTMLDQPSPPLTKRRIVENVYGAAVRLNPRRASGVLGQSRAKKIPSS